MKRHSTPESEMSAPTRLRAIALSAALAIWAAAPAAAQPDFDFVPFDQGGDFYSFEVSSIEVYNLEIRAFGAQLEIVGGPDLRAEQRGRSSNDVLAITGLQDLSGASLVPQRLGAGSVSVQATVGLFTDGKRQRPLFDGILAGQTVAILGIGEVGGSDFIFSGIAPRKDGLQVFARDETNALLFNILLDDVFAVDVRIDKGLFELGNDIRNITYVGARPAGSDQPFDLLFSDEVAILPDEPFDLDMLLAVDSLGDGGRMFFDDIFVTGLEGEAEASVSAFLGDAFDLELDALTLLRFDPNEARSKILKARKKLKKARRSLKKNKGDLHPSTKTSAAKKAVQEALVLDLEILDAIDAGDIDLAIALMGDAALEKARAELFLEGHDPQPGPFPEGFGGFDLDDPVFTDSIFADGFESGDVSAWSTGR